MLIRLAAAGQYSRGGSGLDSSGTERVNQRGGVSFVAVDVSPRRFLFESDVEIEVISASLLLIKPSSGIRPAKISRVLKQKWSSR
jgi:hypothetical protein